MPTENIPLTPCEREAIYRMSATLMDKTPDANFRQCDIDAAKSLALKFGAQNGAKEFVVSVDITVVADTASMASTRIGPWLRELGVAEVKVIGAKAV